MSLRLDGTNVLSHIGVTPESLASDYTFQRNPTSKDYQGFNLMTRWLNYNNQTLWVLVNKVANVATWQQITGVVRTLTSNSGGAVGPNTAGNINVVGDGITITGVGNPATNTITFSLIGSGALESITTDSGTATPLAGVVNFTSINSAGSSTSFSGATNVVTFHTTDSNSNTILGNLAGNSSITGTFNVGLGKSSLHALTSGGQNTSIGTTSATAVTTGARNTSIGDNTLDQLTTGSNNIALGYNAGSNYTTSEGSNIVIGNTGTASESNVIRIGTQGSSAGQQNVAYMAGIYGSSIGATNAPVFVDSTGKLGTGGASTQVAFSAYLSTSPTNVTGDSTVYQVIFDTEYYDLGSNYNTGTGLFTAPITGIYAWNFTVTLSNMGVSGATSSSVDTFNEIFNGITLINNNCQNNSFVYGENGGQAQLTASGIFQMQSGWTMRCSVTSLFTAGASKTVGLIGEGSGGTSDPRTMFSVALISS